MPSSRLRLYQTARDVPRISRRADEASHLLDTCLRVSLFVQARRCTALRLKPEIRRTPRWYRSRRRRGSAARDWDQPDAKAPAELAPGEAVFAIARGGRAFLLFASLVELQAWLQRSIRPKAK